MNLDVLMGRRSTGRPTLDQDAETKVPQRQDTGSCTTYTPRPFLVHADGCYRSIVTGILHCL